MVATTDHRPTEPPPDENRSGTESDAASVGVDPTDAAASVARLFPEVYRRFHTGRRLVGGGSLPVTNRGLAALRHLAAGGPLTVGELAAHMGLRRNSTSELAARLAAKGLVDRIRDERDERRVLVWLTASGRDVVARIGQILAPDLLAEVMARLDPSDRAIVVRGMELLAGAEAPVPRSTTEQVVPSRPGSATRATHALKGDPR